MTVIETLTEGNQAFARDDFRADLKIIPSMKIMLLGCVDPRVDPSAVLGLALGDAAVIGERSPSVPFERWRGRRYASPHAT